MADTRIPQLDGLRAFAFLAVFAHHALKMPLGWLGVDMFFVLSGFLITRNLLELRATNPTSTGLKVFFFRRLLRIIPPYYLAITLVLLVTHHAYEMRWYYLFVSNIHDVTAHVDGGPLGAMWSIAVEEQFYFLWPWLVLTLPRRSLEFVFLALILATPGVRLIMQSVDREAIYRLTPSRMDLLAAGALLTTFDLRSPAWIADRRRLFAIVAAAATAVFIGLTAIDPDFRSQVNEALFNTIGYSLSVVMFGALLAYVRATESGVLHKVLSHSWIRYIGRISYMGYLTHKLFLELLTKSQHFSRVAVAVLALVSTLVFSTLTWYLIERPILGLRGRVSRTPLEPGGATEGAVASRAAV